MRSIVDQPPAHLDHGHAYPEAGYSQIEHESNSILTGMYLNRMYTPRTHDEVVMEREPLELVYNDPRKPKQLGQVPHQANSILLLCHELGNKTCCNYGSQHPLSRKDFIDTEKCLWAMEDEYDILVNGIIKDLFP